MAPFAAKTMSGKPGTGSRRSTRCPVCPIRIDEPQPLPDGQDTIHMAARIHPGVDRIGHIEVGRRAHQVMPKSGMAHGVPEVVQHCGCHP
jgi:hypothetical protein